MQVILLIVMLIIPCLTLADENRCAVIGGAMEQSLFDALQHDLNIKSESIQRSKTRVKMLDISPVSDVFARQLAEKSYQADKRRNGKALVSQQGYYETFSDDGAGSITAKYTYINDKGQRSNFIASSLFNNEECSVRFNGYITLSREF